MSFKEWLLNEHPRFGFSIPIHIKVWLDNGKIESFIVDGIDIRSEDWTLEAGDPYQKRYALSGGINLMANPPRPPRGPFSAPLADGKFINYEFSAEIGTKALFPIIRKDWAKFAEFINGNTVVKEPAYLRGGDSRVG